MLQQRVPVSWLVAPGEFLVFCKEFAGVKGGGPNDELEVFHE
jgi:hypothetical protein